MTERLARPACMHSTSFQLARGVVLAAKQGQAIRKSRGSGQILRRSPNGSSRAGLRFDLWQRLGLLCGDRQHRAIVNQLELRRHYTNARLAQTEEAANIGVHLSHLAGTVACERG